MKHRPLWVSIAIAFSFATAAIILIVGSQPYMTPVVSASDIAMTYIIYGLGVLFECAAGFLISHDEVFDQEIGSPLRAVYVILTIFVMNIVGLLAAAGLSVLAFHLRH